MATRQLMRRGRGGMRDVFCLRRIDGEETSVPTVRRSGAIPLPGNAQEVSCVNEAGLCGSLLQPDSSSREGASSAGRGPPLLGTDDQ